MSRAADFMGRKDGLGTGRVGKFRLVVADLGDCEFNITGDLFQTTKELKRGCFCTAWINAATREFSLDMQISIARKAMPLAIIFSK
jgi:hypothetical protein